MGNKVNLAMQNQFVEFAKKDGEGKDISESITEVKGMIGDVIAFDGEIEFNPNTRVVVNPHKAGLFKVINSVTHVPYGICYTSGYHGSSTNLSFVLYSRPDGDGPLQCEYYVGVGDGDTVTLTSNSLLTGYKTGTPYWDTTPTQNSNKPVTSGGVYSFVKPIYFHPITCELSGTIEVSLTILNDSDVSYNTWTKLKTEMIRVMTNLSGSDARFNCAGSFISNSEVYHAFVIVVNHSTRKIIVYGMNSSGTISNLDLTDLELTPVYDPVNRIN